MSIFSNIRQAYLCYFSKPQADRPVYRAVRRSHAQKILELGVGSGLRSLRLIEVAKKASPGREIHYIGMDPFEARYPTEGTGLTFKAAHQLLRADGVRVQLVPGEPVESIPRMANSLGKVDLMILPGMLDSADYNRFWFFVPRLLHEKSLVFIEQKLADGRTQMQLMPPSKISTLASAGVRRAAA